MAHWLSVSLSVPQSFLISICHFIFCCHPSHLFSVLPYVATISHCGMCLALPGLQREAPLREADGLFPLWGGKHRLHGEKQLGASRTLGAIPTLTRRRSFPVRPSRWRACSSSTSWFTRSRTWTSESICSMSSQSWAWMITWRYCGSG